MLRLAAVEELGTLSDGTETPRASPTVFEDDDTGTRAGAKEEYLRRFEDGDPSDSAAAEWSVFATVLDEGQKTMLSISTDN